jgi:ribose 5-phosphate isomerase B
VLAFFISANFAKRLSSGRSIQVKDLVNKDLVNKDWLSKDWLSKDWLSKMLLMKIALGADHAGFELKDKIKQHLQQQGLEVRDEGTSSPESVDYPDYARAVARDVGQQRADLGILVCGSGIGMAITANKVDGIRAANVSTEYEAQMSREHNNANVLTLGARILQPEEAFRIVDKWLATSFAGGRHERRVEKIMAIEKEEDAAGAARKS